VTGFYVSDNEPSASIKCGDLATPEEQFVSHDERCSVELGE